MIRPAIAVDAAFLQKNLTLFQKQPRRVVLLSTAALLSVGSAVFVVQRFQSSKTDSTEQATQPEIKTVAALGRLEPQDQVIKLDAPTSTQESRIDQLLVQEGDRVQAGQVVAVLDARDRLQATLLKAQEQVQVAQAKLAQVQAGAKTGEIQAQRSEVARLEAERIGNLNTQSSTVACLEAEGQNAQVEYQRYEMLYQEGAVSASQRDSKQTTFKTTQRQLQEARAALDWVRNASEEQVESARATLDKIAEVRPVDVQAARAEVSSAQAAVAEAKANLEQTFVRSPREGRILKIHTYPGEKLSDDGIADLGQTGQMYAIAEVYESDVQKLRVGQAANVTSTAIPAALHGTVEQVGYLVQRQGVINSDPAANTDARVVEVKVRLDEASSQQAARLSNLQVNVEIQL